MVSDSQLKFIADILITIGEVCFASLIIPYLTMSGLNPNQFIGGLIATFGSWIIGLVVIKNIS